jgi:hypothetical protein
MATIHYVASCWQYSRICTLALSQFVLHPPRDHKCRVTVCHCRESDPQTTAVLDYFAESHSHSNIEWDWRNFERRRLMRRAISRNEVAKSTTADYVIFADIDYMPAAPGVIDATIDAMSAATSGGKKPALMFPPHIESSKTHGDGDAEFGKVVGRGIYSLDPSKYQATKLPRAIGGFQGVTGETARQFGYVPNLQKHHRPADAWMRTFCDRAYRQQLAEHCIFQRPIEVAGWHRVRHGERGRFNSAAKL